MKKKFVNDVRMIMTIKDISVVKLPKKDSFFEGEVKLGYIMDGKNVLIRTIGVSLL